MSLLRELSCNVCRPVKTTGLLWSSQFRWGINPGMEGAGGGVLAKLLFPQESECVVFWTSLVLFSHLIVQLQVRFHLSLLSPDCVRPARLPMPGMRPVCLTPVSGTSGSDGVMPQVTPADSESLQCKKAAMHHWRHKWHSRATGQIVATHCVAQDHSCTLDLRFLLLRTRPGHALTAGRNRSIESFLLEDTLKIIKSNHGSNQEQLQKIGFRAGGRRALVVWLILVQQNYWLGYVPAHRHSCQCEMRRSIQSLGKSLSSYLWSPLKGPVASKWADPFNIPWNISICEYPIQLSS